MNQYLLKDNILEKKRLHNCEAGWWGTLFLDQIWVNCKPPPVADITSKLSATDSVYIEIIDYLFNIDDLFKIFKLKITCIFSYLIFNLNYLVFNVLFKKVLN